jgi:hypothetical protein
MKKILLRQGVDRITAPIKKRGIEQTPVENQWKN